MWSSRPEVWGSRPEVWGGRPEVCDALDGEAARGRDGFIALLHAGPERHAERGPGMVGGPSRPMDPREEEEEPDSIRARRGTRIVGRLCAKGQLRRRRIMGRGGCCSWQERNKENPTLRIQGAGVLCIPLH